MLFCHHYNVHIVFYNVLSMHDGGSIKKEKERAMWYFIVSISSGALDQQGVPILSVKFKKKKAPVACLCL